ncbi:hypothetical protein [Desulfovibrio legallii]|jgi:hypothetical protein|uniref:Uncharacterized protein n=1 Tax=Desulfovibrio legallii TaxID=571438 RepID=A0A1G7LZM8_9BACT|nr:hypothetical protein [Desulfovibrio legallii]SDF54893.1 hypothetical protein SAMN05192586_10787 [Desulfovibrio legallii]
MPHTPTPPPAASAAASDAAWREYARFRGVQRRLGACCAALLVLALLALADGIQGLMRAGADVLELTPGESLSVSGPAALKNPVDSDLQVTFDPPDPALTFRLEGFFTGYWMGNGMWRAQVAAGPAAEPGRYSLRIRFRDAPASTDQSLSVLVYADDSARRAAALSLLQRLLGWSPFILAASLFLPVLVAGVLVFALGSRCQRLLAALGCGEVLRVQAEATGRRLWCLLLGAPAPAPGTPCAVLDPQGRPLGQAVAQALPPKPRGVLELLLEQNTAVAFPSSTRSAVRPGCLVRLRPPRPRTPQATGR